MRSRRLAIVAAVAVALASAACSDSPNAASPTVASATGSPSPTTPTATPPTPSPPGEAVYWAVDEGADNWPDREKLRVWLFVPRPLLGVVTLFAADGSAVGHADVMGSGYFSGPHCQSRVPDDNPTLVVVGPVQIDTASQAAFLAAPTTYRAEVDQRELGIPNPKHLQLPLVDSGCRSAPRTVAPCLNEALPPPMPGEPSEAWLRARARLPADVQVLRPERMPDGFGPPVLLEACVRGLFGDDGPRYTIVLDGPSGSVERIAFGLGLGFGEWGNFPGPPTTTEQTTVRGASASLITTESVSASDPALVLMMVSWTENGQRYWVRAASRGQMTKEELVTIAQGLTPVP